MDRREAIIGAGALASVLLAKAAFADDDHAHMHDHHHGANNASLVAAASDCVRAGQVCVDHCLSMIEKNDTSTAGCLRNVNQLLPVCQALVQLAAQNSRHLGHYARVAADLCKDCEDECRKHEKEHQACRDCADACAACAKECQKVAL